MMAFFCSMTKTTTSEVRQTRREAAGPIAATAAMASIDDTDLDTFCGRVGRAYSRRHLCPPFELRHAAESWINRGIPLTHCLDVVERFLDRQAGSCYSGSGDWNFAWLNSRIQTTWYDWALAMPPQASPKDMRRHGWLDENDARESNQRPGRRAGSTVGMPSLDSKRDSFEPDRIGLRQQGAGASSPTTDTKSDSSPIRQRRHGASRLVQQTPASIPKKIDVAVAWLRAELASGERTAVEVESDAICAGIAPRTYDRARKRLGITSWRIGFGRWAKYVIALPTPHATPNGASTEAGVT